jgi:hypothetical protein
VTKTKKRTTGRRGAKKQQDPAVYQYYLHDLGYILLERAREAKKEKDAAADKGDRDYSSGRLMAYNEVISLMQNQARVFGIHSVPSGWPASTPTTSSPSG